MSGHSKWHKIKHQKETTDKKKGLAFGKLAREIVTAARKEKDPAKNATLRDTIARAKKVNMPQENIDRLLAGTDKPLEPVMYEGFGPGGSALLISAETDNPNRTVSELRVVFRDYGGHLGDPGTVAWKFKAVYQCVISKDNLPISSADLELALIDAGADDIKEENQIITVTAQPSAQETISAALRSLNLHPHEEGVVSLALEQATLGKEETAQFAILLEQLSNYPDVVNVTTNVSQTSIQSS